MLGAVAAHYHTSTWQPALENQLHRILMSGLFEPIGALEPWRAER